MARDRGVRTLGPGDLAYVADRRRRWPVGTIVTVLVLALLVAAWWFLWVPNWRPSLQPGERFGIDVSSHQGRIDWGKVSRDDIRFTYIKASEGGDLVDPRFRENWIGAGRAGLDRGAYHFFTLCTGGAAQARNFLMAAPPVKSVMAPAVDLELAGNCKARPDAVDVDRELDSFLLIVEQAWGQKVVLYVGDDFNHQYPGRRDLARPLWHRRFLVHPDITGWSIWQISGFAHVEGISGRVDLDLMRSP